MGITKDGKNLELSLDNNQDAWLGNIPTIPPRGRHLPEFKGNGPISGEFFVATQVAEKENEQTDVTPHPPQKSYHAKPFFGLVVGGR